MINQVFRLFENKKKILINFIFLVRFDNNEEEVYNKARNLQTFINQQSNKLIQTVENHKNAYIDVIEKHRRTHKQS
jgi:hypothetical protein